MKTETEEKKGRKAIKSNAIGHVADCRCVVCRNSDFTKPKSEPQQMSDEEMREAIGIACGWTFHDCDYAPKDGGAVFEKFWIRPGVILEELTANDIAWREGRSLPDYINSLDAMHEAEKTLTDEQHYDFRVELWAVTQPTEIRKIASLDHNRAYASATARQRALAFIQAIDRKTNP